MSTMRMMGLAIGLFALTWSQCGQASGENTPDPTSECEEFDNCEACISHTSCGWCSGACLDGDGDGPEQSCDGEWHYSLGSCPAAPSSGDESTEDY